MKEVLEREPNLRIKQAEVADVVVEQLSALSSQLSVRPDTTENRELRTENCIRGVLLRDGRSVSASSSLFRLGPFLTG